MDRKPTAIDIYYARKGAFFFVFFIVVLITYGILFFIDFVPEDPGSTDREVSSRLDENPVSQAGGDTRTLLDESTPYATPNRIIFDALDREVAVLNPTSNTIADLDAALLEGAVRHPDSATLREEGNVFILGHSSSLPTVRNRNFQAFNGIEDHKYGDIIRLQSEDREYLYRVDRVYEAKASEVRVPTDSGIPKLTLATCNSFGSKDDRFIVEATLIDSYAL